MALYLSFSFMFLSTLLILSGKASLSFRSKSSEISLGVSRKNIAKGFPDLSVMQILFLEKDKVDGYKRDDCERTHQKLL